MSRVVSGHVATLARDGWCVVERALDARVLRAVESDLAARFAATPLCQGAFYGERTRRFGALLSRSAYAEQLVMHPLVLAVAEQVLAPWCERVALNLTQAIEIQPGALPQLPHRDQDMWQGPKGCLEYLVNVMWPLTAFTAENGGTRLWTGSHIDQDVVVLPESDAVVPRVAVVASLAFAAPAQADEVARWRPVVEEASARFGVPADWIERVMRAESGGRTLHDGRPIRSPKGAMGLMQLMPGTWTDKRSFEGAGVARQAFADARD